MCCSPSDLVFVLIFKSSNELSFEDFSLFEDIFRIFRAVLRSCFRRTQPLPQRQDPCLKPLPRLLHNWPTTRRRSVQLISSRQHPLLAVWMTR